MQITLQTKTMDALDRKILSELQEDARTSFAELGRRIGLTTPAVIERVRKLEDAQIIKGYRAEIDTAKIGLPITAFIRMSIVGVEFKQIVKIAEDSSEVLECHRATGGDSFIMKVAVSSVEHLQNVIDKLTPFGVTTTSIVLSSPVQRRIIEAKNE
jgi:Lrp/AsnC family transcriptional regulator, leucine-responsive regulatory protein